MILTSREDKVEQYMKLADITREAEYLYEQSRTSDNKERYLSAVRTQRYFYTRHNLTREEIDLHMKKGVQKFNNVQDAMASMFGKPNH